MAPFAPHSDWWICDLAASEFSDCEMWCMCYANKGYSIRFIYTVESNHN